MLQWDPYGWTLVLLHCRTESWKHSKLLKSRNYFTTPHFLLKLFSGSNASQRINSAFHSFPHCHHLWKALCITLKPSEVCRLIIPLVKITVWGSCQQCLSLWCTHYLDPAAILVPSLLKTTWFAFMVKRVRIPSGAPSGNVCIWTVLFDTAVINLPF